MGDMSKGADSDPPIYPATYEQYTFGDTSASLTCLGAYSASDESVFGALFFVPASDTTYYGYITTSG
jgi:hypothetical protein